MAPSHSDPVGLTYRYIEPVRTNAGSAPSAVRHPCGQSRCHSGSHSKKDPIEENLGQKLAKSTDLVKDLRTLMLAKRRSFRKEDEGLIERARETLRKLESMPPALEDLSDTTEIDETTDRMNLHSGNVYLDAARAGFNVRAAIKYGWAGPGDGDSTENCGLGVLIACKEDGDAVCRWVCHDCDNTGCMKCMHIPLENRARKQTLKDLCYMVLQRAHLVRRYDVMLQHMTASPPEWLRKKMKDPEVAQTALDFAVEKMKELGMVNATAYAPSVPVREPGAPPALGSTLSFCRVHVHRISRLRKQVQIEHRGIPQISEPCPPGPGKTGACKGPREGSVPRIPC